MSPGPFATPTPDPIGAAARRLRVRLGIDIRDARLARRWSIRELADRARLSPAVAYRVEAGEAWSPEAVLRVVHALGLRLEFELLDPRKRADAPLRTADPVHAAMGEFEATRLRSLRYPVGIDEPYQHYQFAGRADVVAWDVGRRGFLHLENRTRFPDFQEMAGSYNAKRAYLAASLGERVGVRRWESETHVIVGLWSSEVLHSLRLRRESFRALCPDPAEAFVGWWEGRPAPVGKTSTLVVLDPDARPRQRDFIGFDEALTARPRHRGYADAAAKLVR
jgi:transcriptional regulator with XRE-family HTH domain